MLTEAQWAALAEWMRRQGFGESSFDDVLQLSGGTQNVMLRFDWGDQTYVLRRGPLNLRQSSNNVMRREMRVLQALNGTTVPHPRLIRACEDDAVLGGAVFFLMEVIDGFNPADSVDLPPLYRDNEKTWYQAGLRVVDALAAIGAVDYAERGLADLGRPEGFLQRQVGRWLSELKSYTEIPGYSGSDLRGVDDVARWLDDRVPESSTPGLMHGDFHLGNVMLSQHRADVAAVVDWEMCTLGDPMLDLGWLLATWPHEGDAATVGPTGVGLPSKDEVLARYASVIDHPVRNVEWYEVLARFKLAIILEGTHARAKAGLASPETGRKLHAQAMQLLDGAWDLMRRHR